jgi:hypothetical protein
MIQLVTELPTSLVGSWCLDLENMTMTNTYVYHHCKKSAPDIIVQSNGFDAQETSCELKKIQTHDSTWVVTFHCTGAGIDWHEDDTIRIRKDSWTLKTQIRNVYKKSDPIRYCLMGGCD